MAREIDMSVGERIAELRKSQNLSQVQLAKALQISRQAISKWENDLSAPDTEHMILLADLLDTDIEYLSSGRRSMGRRLPVVLEQIKTVEIEKEVPVPVVQVVEKIVEKPVVEYIEKPVVRKIYRTRYVRNPVELCVIGFICFLAGLILGVIL